MIRRTGGDVLVSKPVKSILIENNEEQAKVDVLILAAKDKQINLLKARDEMNEKMVKLVKPKWYENQYVWAVVGFIFGKI